ncbi:MFS transporter [Gordonia sp. CPCC 205515]|uniref:MFS transporter n=1 Tax=Gordonia sp. CPCC 205515 TaxID=3140791 RepID=UPI003AF3EADF
MSVSDNLPPLTTRAPDAIGPPTGPAVPHSLSKKLLAAFLLTYVGFWIAYLTPPIVSMSLRLADILPQGQRATALSLVLGAGGIVALLTNPIVGALSDRTRSRFGMRTPWIVGGTIVSVLGFTLLALSSSVPGILVGYLIGIAGAFSVLAALIALIPDQVPPAQRGWVSGLAGMCVPVGAVAGAALTPMLATHGPVAMFVGPCVLMVIGTGWLLTVLDDRRLDPQVAAAQPAFSLSWLLRSYWISPRKHPDFGWTWLSRFLLFMGTAILVGYQLLYLVNQLHYTMETVAGIVAISSAVHYAFTFAFSPIAGKLSDRIGRRKVFVAAGAAIYAGGMIAIALAHSLPLFLIGMAITGIGEGIYLAVDLALVTEVIPDQNDTARAMGLFNVANTVPPALAPAIAPAFLAIPAFGILSTSADGNFVALYLASAVFALLGAIVIRKVRGVR